MKRVFLVGWIFSFVLMANITYAQKGSTYGVITEQATGTDLPGASVLLKGTTIGTITDVYGKYVLTDLPVGKDTLIYSYVGYQKRIIVVNVLAGQSVEKNVSLVPAQVGLHEVVVTGQILGQAKAINQQLKSDALVNVVSESKIHELPDVNAAEAIGRISGVAVQRNSGEGQKIMLRGLSPKFTAVTINGARVASNSSTDKSVDLSMISPELLDGIEVYKSPTSDMDGEAVGGTVNLIIKKAPKKKYGYIKLEGGYNTLEKICIIIDCLAVMEDAFLTTSSGLLYKPITKTSTGGMICSARVLPPKGMSYIIIISSCRTTRK